MDKIARARLIEAIANHLAAPVLGPWEVVREEFPDVSPATFWRCVKRVRQGVEGRPTAAKARRQLAGHVDAELSALPQASQRQPASISSQLNQLFADIDFLRAYAVKDGAIKNPLLFAQSIGLRDRALGTAVRCREALVYAENAEAFYATLIEEVAAESPDAARRIMRRLKRVNSEL